eukprot:CAMPEP_0177641398 /NCGR_PEP_ID=MMETSP0447-20121125/7043_1 /TAXON_ID=0 /ORGANISM="Stygamoeba regulata, Strain BSH-02190019" /LENGTH=434 /DNA_ID=CAMNT_0019143509 /DNA_START=177 /DNA_END=1481 /DNA_ORIENTATION=+
MGQKGTKELKEVSVRNSYNFELGRVIGKGSFGKVYAIHSRVDKNTLFALKLMNKFSMIERNMVDKILLERDLLLELCHPFIIRLYYAFQTSKDLCLVMELMHGGDLRYHLVNDKKFSLPRTIFYGAQILLGLEYLHKNGVVHRDIKPDNMLLDERGFLRLMDFNVAAKIVPGNTLSGASGTRSYQPPEVHLRLPYNESVDIWAFCVVLYEMYYGYRPFSSRDKDKKLQKIIDFHYTKHPDDSPEELTELFQLIFVPAERRATIPQIKELAMFSQTEWDALLNKEVVPPFVPKPNRANVDARHDFEEIFEVSEDSKTKKKQQADVQSIDQSLFESWDYVPEQEANCMHSPVHPRLSRKELSTAKKLSQSTDLPEHLRSRRSSLASVKRVPRVERASSLAVTQKKGKLQFEPKASTPPLNTSTDSGALKKAKSLHY